MDRENRMGVDAGYGLTGLGVRKRKGFFAFEREVKLDTDRCDVRSPDLHRRVDGDITSRTVPDVLIEAGELCERHLARGQPTPSLAHSRTRPKRSPYLDKLALSCASHHL